MKKIDKPREEGSMLVMAVVLSFALFVMGLSFLQWADTFQKSVSYDVARAQDYYSAGAASVLGVAWLQSGGVTELYPSRWTEYLTNNWYRADIDFSGYQHVIFGSARGYTVIGSGRSTYYGSSKNFEREIKRNYVRDTFADYLWITDKERDPYRNEIVRWWTPDTLDGKVHSNDTLHIQSSADRPVFLKKVTSSAAPYIDPPYNHARFDEGFEYAPPIFFPDQAEEIRAYSSIYNFGTFSPDSATELTFDGSTVHVRYFGKYETAPGDSAWGTTECINQFHEPDHINDLTMDQLTTTGALFVHGKLFIKAARNTPDDFMNWENECPNIWSYGFEGRLTVASSDTMIIAHDLIYRFANPDNSVPGTIDSIGDVLGLISENYIMIGDSVNSTCYVNAAMAAIKGAITVQDIYNYGQSNEKQSLFIYGSLAQKNRGLVHSSYGGGLRGFIEKDYHYDKRLQEYPPPHFLRTREHDQIYWEDFPGA